MYPVCLTMSAFPCILIPRGGPGFHRLEIIDNERGSRILKHILVLHRVSDVPAANVNVVTVSIEADRGDISPSRLGCSPDPSQRMSFQIGQFFLGEQSLRSLSETLIYELYSVSRRMPRRQVSLDELISSANWR